jgi:hypothetical protein
MSADFGLKDAELQATPRPDRRLRTRYPIRLDLQYKLLNRGPVKQTGSRRTLNLNSGGIFFETNDFLPTRGLILLVMRWPILLDGACPLKVLVQGRIVRTDAKGTAVRVSSYEFCTGKVQRPRA